MIGQITITKSFAMCMNALLLLRNDQQLLDVYARTSLGREGSHFLGYSSYPNLCRHNASQTACKDSYDHLDPVSHMLSR